MRHVKFCADRLEEVRIAEHVSKHPEADLMRVVVDTVTLSASLLYQEDAVPLARLTPR